MSRNKNFLHCCVKGSFFYTDLTLQGFWILQWVIKMATVNESEKNMKREFGGKKNYEIKKITYTYNGSCNVRVTACRMWLTVIR